MWDGEQRDTKKLWLIMKDLIQSSHIIKTVILLKLIVAYKFMHLFYLFKNQYVSIM